MSKMPDACYMCDKPGTTKEHVPPKSFFPQGRRTNIWTVPSCPEHNIDNSRDVEYVRNAICIHYGTNTAAKEVFEVAKRSYDHSPALFNRTFSEIAAIRVNGEEVGQFPFDLARVKAVVNAIVHALSYRDFGRQYIGQWRVFCATLRSPADVPPENVAKWDRRRRTLETVPYTSVEVPEPEVFSYGIGRLDDGGFAYRLVFYGGFVVYSWPILTDGKRATMRALIGVFVVAAFLAVTFGLWWTHRLR